MFLQQWTPAIPWRETMVIDAKSYNAWVERYCYFGTVGEKTPGVRGACCAKSPSGKYAFSLQTIPRGEAVKVFSGNRRGWCYFNGDVIVPSLLDLSWYDQHENVWMSITPSEVVTLRPGTRKAKGRVVIAGLGLGHQLREVAARKKVTEITVVELDQEIVDWLWPRIRASMPAADAAKVKTVLVADARKALVNLEADVALVDIDRAYGGNTFDVPTLIGTVWVWGSAERVKGSGDYLW